MITFENVTKNYSTNIGLDDVSVHIEKGDFVFLVGPSGAGKSTFIKLILKEIDADKGKITACGMDVTRLSNREIPMLRRKIGMVFQDFRLLPKMTVYENVAFAMEILHQSRRKIRKRVPQILSLVGISDKADQYPDELSAGEQQRVAIARAIINNPTMLIADEPTGNLDPDTAWEIMDLLNQINMTGTTIVMVTHAKDIVDRMGKRVVAIDHGKIVRDEFGAYGFETEEQSSIEDEEAEFKAEMYEAETEDTEVDFDDIAVNDDDLTETNADDEGNVEDAVETEAEPEEIQEMIETEGCAEEETEAEEAPKAEEAVVDALTEEVCEETAEEEAETEDAPKAEEAAEEVLPEEACVETPEEEACVETPEEEAETEEAPKVEEAAEEVLTEGVCEEITEEADVEESPENETAPKELADDFHLKMQVLQAEIFGNMDAIKATHTAQDERLAKEEVIIISEEEGQGNV